MELRITAVSDKGCVRENNEDMVLVGKKLIRDDHLQGAIEPDSIFMVAVSDGMGGANAGEVASQIVLEMVRDGIYNLEPGKDDDFIKLSIGSLCKEIHQKILQEGIADTSKQGMGATLIALLHYDSRLIFMNAGDSRLYRFRDEILRQVSDDHSLRQLSKNSEVPTNIITNSFGGGKEFFIDIGPAGKRVMANDVFVLCSDGVTDMLTDDEIEEILCREGGEDTLLQACKDKGGKDNISYVIVEVSDVEE